MTTDPKERATPSGRTRSGPLAGMRVLELAQIMSGPTGGMLLADLGADVIKVEKLPGGDDSRGYTDPRINGVSAPFLMMNRNKRGVALNLKHPQGREVLLRLVGRADVLLENFRTGTMAKLGLGYPVLRTANPGLIYCAVSGYGHTGPYADKGGFDLIAQGFGGLMSITGEPGGPPAKVGPPVSDINGGMAPDVTEDTTAGFWGDGAEGYSYDDGSSEWFSRMGSYVAGTATNMAFLDTLNAGNVEANYVGFAMHSGVDVAIHVDFGDSTWSGTWNGGRDGYVNVATDGNGVRHVEGEVGFRVDAGHLSGPNLIADRLSAGDGTVRGSVEGSFFGSEAQVVGGINDITKTVTADSVGEGGVTYNAARNVDTFVTIREDLADRVGDVFRNNRD